MRSTQNIIILFTIILTGLVGFEPFSCLKLCKAEEESESELSNKVQEKYDHLLQQLEVSSSVHFPFGFKFDAIKHLRLWSPKHKRLYLRNYRALLNVDSDFAPVSALTKTIDEIFQHYESKAIKDPIEFKSIREKDPIGFILYVTRKFKTNSTIRFRETIAEFYATMLNRLLLFHCKTNISLIYDSAWDLNGDCGIPKLALKQIATEGATLGGIAIGHFLEIAMEQFPHLKLYDRPRHLSDYQYYQMHEPADTDDVQIFFSGDFDSRLVGHWFCIRYEATTENVVVYDKTMKGELEPIHRAIINRLYPYHNRISFRTPKTIQTDDTSCGLYSIIYATTIIFGEEPAKYELKKNNIIGDESLYMRLHILKMFAHRKLALFKGW